MPNMYATELGDVGFDPFAFVDEAKKMYEQGKQMVTDPFGASQSNNPYSYGNESSTDPMSQAANNTGIVDPRTQTSPDPSTATSPASSSPDATKPQTTTPTDSSDLDVGGFLKRNLTPRPLPAVVGVGVGGYTYIKSKKVLRSIGFGIGAMIVGNFIQSRVEMSKAGGN